MLARLARLLVRRRRAVFVAGLVFMAVAGVVGGGVATHLSSGGFDDPTSEAVKAREALLDRFGTGSPNVVLLVSAPGGSVDDQAVATAGREITARLAGRPGVTEVASYWTLGSPPPLKSNDGSRALVFGRIVGDDDAVRTSIKELSPAFTGSTAGVDVRVTGQAEVFRSIGTTIESDLKRAESIAVPITLVLLVVIFGSLVAASLPLLTGALSVLSTFLILRLLTLVTDVSIFALNLTTALGLGLAIDYSLFIVSRYREELAAGFDPHDAVVRTVRTAGKTVAFSAATVAISLSALLVFPQFFLRSFAYAGIAVALSSAAASIVVLPAVLALLGRRVDRLRLGRRAKVRAADTGLWHRIAVAVMRRPISIATVVIAVLLVLGTPFLGIKLGQSDHRVLPSSSSARQTQEIVTSSFGSREASALEVIPAARPGSALTASQVDDYATRLSKVAAVARVDASTGSYVSGTKVAPPNPSSARFTNGTDGWLSVVPSVEPVSPAGEALVRAVRNLDAPVPMIVGGPSAQLLDSKEAIFSRIPLAIGIIAAITLVVLFLMFGSVLAPLKALVLNVLSLSAVFGSMVWIFQEGHLSGALGFTPTGTIDLTMPILMFCIAFGLSMDYEVFLLSRIKEEHDRTGDNTHSVAMGLEHTGRIVTAAAVLIAVVFIAFATSGITFIKMFGLGLAVAVLVDAFLIRATLVPAFMRLAGEANWWAPAPLRRIYERFGISDHDDLDDVDTPHEPRAERPDADKALVAVGASATVDPTG